MEKAEFVDAVMARLVVQDERSVEFIRGDIGWKFEEGWTVEEVVAYLRNTEEVNPDLPEAVGLARMSKVRAAVMLRLEKIGKARIWPDS